MLNAVLRQVKKTFGARGVDAVMTGMGKRAVEKFKSRITAPDARGRATELAAALRDEGVEADVVDLDGMIQLREHNCPYSKTVGEHPEVCSIIHTVLHETVAPQAIQVESIATGGDACRFEIK
jgi:predicted ArsR family transcriptional regulator